MSNLTTYSINALANAICRNVELQLPSSLWVAVHSADATVDASQAEFTGVNYERQEVADAMFDAAVSGKCVLNADVVFPTAGSNWGPAAWLSLWDAQEGGNPWFQGPTAQQATGQPLVQITTGQVFRLPAGSLTVGMQ